jgi:hypothetical protein
VWPLYLLRTRSSGWDTAHGRHLTRRHLCMHSLGWLLDRRRAFAGKSARESRLTTSDASLLLPDECPVLSPMSNSFLQEGTHAKQTRGHTGLGGQIAILHPRQQHKALPGHGQQCLVRASMVEFAGCHTRDTANACVADLTREANRPKKSSIETSEHIPSCLRSGILEHSSRPAEKSGSAWTCL